MMNERIKELVKEAGLDDPMCPIDEWDNPELEKFAELIVGECANYLDAFNKENMVEEGMDGAYMKAHFGVEE